MQYIHVIQYMNPYYFLPRNISLSAYWNIVKNVNPLENLVKINHLVFFLCETMLQYVL